MKREAEFLWLVMIAVGIGLLSRWSSHGRELSGAARIASASRSPAFSLRLPGPRDPDPEGLPGRSALESSDRGRGIKERVLEHLSSLITDLPVPDLHQRRAKILSLVSTGGREFSSGGQRYRLLPNARAIPLTDSVNVDRTPLVEIRAAYAILKTGPDEPLWPDALPVVYNPSTGNLGIVTGAVQVKWKSPDAKLSLAADYRLDPVQSFDHLGVTYYRSQVSQPSELLALVSQLEQDQRVSQVNLHVFESLAKSQ